MTLHPYLLIPNITPDRHMETIEFFLKLDALLVSICRYILGVLMHATAWNRLWGGDETLN